MACDEHAPLGWRLADDAHPVGPMCNMPSTYWQDGTCKWLVDDETLRLDQGAS